MELEWTLETNGGSTVHITDSGPKTACADELMRRIGSMRFDILA